MSFFQTTIIKDLMDITLLNDIFLIQGDSQIQFFFKMLITHLIFELSLSNKKRLAAYYRPFYGILIKNPQN